MIPLLGLQVVYKYGRTGSSRPPVTAALLAANVLVFLRPGPLDKILPKTNCVAFNYQLFLRTFLWKNFFMSPFYHGNEFHLFSNMTSLLWTGVQLETLMGSVKFASGISVLVSQCLCLLGDDIAYFDNHSIGFSGVLFGMKVVQTARSDLFIWLPGMSLIPAKYGVWAELFLTHALFPKASFVGHLGGLLAGYVYLWLKHSFRGADPLTHLISGGARVVTSQVRFAQKLLRSVLPQGHTTGRGRVACHSTARECPRGLWICSTCNNYNSLATDICETCSTMRVERAFHQARFNGELPVEEIRRRRLDRFAR
ncbi:hypothetical protein HU200_056842 [Digitaria exilis]|uniref:RanBP2-type domain-containing protein n=1 Tax=Digitaria exilis TaxID=1010633 RepID=A0A835AGP8_9POAL|nr:hypothetical protein HU200_056842 [Digitaria exilis]